ncbi:ABC transporter substrate-binding protein [Natrinema sp. SYSU A 869]|uniref:ABC transporter substrate-binding protein n=1 Tax=Natrinema sp. SYSU A 869 TaxID=2871694 RepID=UPI001CA460C8|nr:ABC transporter substrate-binding protein [Natrinema sp. SYSU A 869]
MANQPDQINYNPFGQQTPGVLNKIIFEQGARWHADEGEWAPLLVESWEYPSTVQSGATVRFDLYDTYTWFNGDAYTAEDFVGQMRWRNVNNDAVWDFLDDVEQTGEYSVEMTLAEKIDTQLFENALFGMGDAPTNWTFKFDVFRDYLERMEDADSDEDRSTILQELAEWNVSLDEAREKGLGNGPFMPSESTANQLLLEKYEDYQNPHITANDIAFDTMEALPLQGPQEKLRSLRNNEVDALHNVAFNSAQADQIPDNYESVRFYSHSGESISFNCRREPLDNQRVRWALSNVLQASHDTLMQNLPLSDVNKERVNLSAGMSQPLIDEWLGDVKGQFMQFDGGTERATKLLRDEGFTQENGMWYKPGGEQFTLTFRDAGFHSNRTETASRILSDFGIETEAIIVEDTTYFGQTVPERDYDLTNWWVGQSAPLPYEGFQNHLVNEAWVTAYPLGVSSVSEWNGEGTSEFIVEVPPIGEPDGELREMNIRERLQATARGQSREEQRPHIQQLAWFWNWMDASWGPWTLYIASEYYNTENWNWPANDSAIMKTPSVQDWPVRQGQPMPNE